MIKFTAEQRAKNDLPAWQPIGEALSAPGPALSRLIEAAQLEALSHGGKEARRHAVAWLAAHGSHGLVTDAKSAQAARAHGFKGLTVSGRRAIRDATSLLREYQGSLATGLLTLPPHEAENTSREHLAKFQSRWLFFARRMLLAQGLEPLVVIVAEIHPHRKTLGGGPIVHWHWVARVSKEPYGKWAVSVGDWHRVASMAHRSAFGTHRPHQKGNGVQGLRKDPGRYLSKYLSKARSNCEAYRGTEWERCIPRQWWTWTGEMRALVQACRLRPPSGFLRWCCRWAVELADLGDAISEPIQIGEDGPIVGRWFCWRDEEALDRAIEAWIAEELALSDWIKQEQQWTVKPWRGDGPAAAPPQWPHPDAPGGSFPPRQD